MFEVKAIFWVFRVLRFWGWGLGFEGFRVEVFWVLRVLGFERFRVLGFEGFGVLRVLGF